MANFRIPIFVAILFLGSSVSGLIFTNPFAPTPVTNLKWNGLETTFALDGVLSPLKKDTTGYSPVPRTKSDAEINDWVKVSDACENNGQFNGFRYVYQKEDGTMDTSVSALYDANGVIAGLQMNIKKSVFESDPNNTYKVNEIPMFLVNSIEGEDVYTLTAYFVNPATICGSGRSAKDLETTGTGTALYFQNGTTPSETFIAPMNRSDALKLKWSNNNCFFGMGVHNWYDQEHFQDTNCDTILPVFLLYTLKDQLLGFGFQHVGKSIATRYEQPPASVVKAIVGKNVSQCLIDKVNTVGVTTMHVFLIDDPLSQNCFI